MNGQMNGHGAKQNPRGKKEVRNKALANEKSKEKDEKFATLRSLTSY